MSNNHIPMYILYIEYTNYLGNTNTFLWDTSLGLNAGISNTEDFRTHYISLVDQIDDTLFIKIPDYWSSNYLKVKKDGSFTEYTNFDSRIKLKIKYVKNVEDKKFEDSYKYSTLFDRLYITLGECPKGEYTIQGSSDITSPLNGLRCPIFSDWSNKTFTPVSIDICDFRFTDLTKISKRKISSNYKYWDKLIELQTNLNKDTDKFDFNSSYDYYKYNNKMLIYIKDCPKGEYVIKVTTKFKNVFEYRSSKTNTLTGLKINKFRKMSETDIDELINTYQQYAHWASMRRFYLGEKTSN